MVIRISPQLRRRIPENQKEGLDDFLWDKSGGRCFLCEGKLNRATDDIQADHDSPHHEGGATDRQNLNLVHASCNQVKRNFPSGDVRPYLRVRAFAHEKGNVIGYGDLQQHFAITPKESVLEWSEGDTEAHLQYPNGTEETSRVFVDTDGSGQKYYYIFASLPREAIFNDDECQPRSIKLDQIWKIFTDTQGNPLHEPPSCRVIPANGKIVRLAMFDGQHKTVSMWMHNDVAVVAKVYLNLSKEQTIKLVGSIQSKIKKLPLSSFESALKMGEEWLAHVQKYLDQVGPDELSEDGLIKSLDPQLRTRAKSAFKDQLLKEVLEVEELKILEFVKREGAPNPEWDFFRETTFKTKVVSVLRHTKPLVEKGEEREKARAREIENMKFALNTLVSLAFLNEDGGPELSEVMSERRRRMMYQSSLAYISQMIQKLYRQVLRIDEDDRALLEKEPTEQEKIEIQDGIRRLVDHPIWTCDWEKSDKTRAVRDALSKNQDAANAFRAVELRGDHISGSEDLPPDWYR